MPDMEHAPSADVPSLAVRPAVRSVAPGGRDPVQQRLEHHRQFLLRKARYLTGNESDAEDLIHDTFLKALTKLDTFADPSQDPARERAWLSRVMVNRFYDKLRTRKRHVSLDEAPALAAPEAEPKVPWDHITAEDVNRAAEDLPPKLRDVFVLFYRERLDYRGIEARTGVSRRTIGTRLFRARQTLREVLRRRVRGGSGETT